MFFQSDYLNALRLVRRGSGKKSWRLKVGSDTLNSLLELSSSLLSFLSKVLRVSLLLNEGFDELWSMMGEFIQHAKVRNL